jgi:hypothetical protein
MMSDAQYEHLQGFMIELINGLALRIDALDAKFDGRIDRLERDMNRRFDLSRDHVDERFARVDERFQRVEVRLDRVDERLDRVEVRLDRVDERLGRLEPKRKRPRDRE